MSVRLSFLGAADTVTGSRTLVSFQRRRWLVDCGLFQGAKSMRERNWARFSPDASSLDSVILTHAHLDHSGYLPRLCREGFGGPVLTTAGTRDLCGLLLRDAAKIEEESARYANESGYSNHRPALPLFTGDDVEVALSRFLVHPRHQWTPLDKGVSIRFLRAGHIIGSSLVQFSFDIDGTQKIVTFTGDLGNGRSFVLRNPDALTETDVLVLESTYGARTQPRTSPLDGLAKVVERTVARQGAVIIPAFAVGRAQELTYMLRLLEDRGRIPMVPVILDSPMATSAMRVYMEHPEDHIFESAFVGSEDAFLPHRFEISTSVEESARACTRPGPLVVISASGMLSGGRILHHLKRRLPDPRNTVLFTGYQAEGSKGRFVQEQAQRIGTVRIHHEEIPVAAEIVTLENLSAHADQDDILGYLDRMRRLPKSVIMNHGMPAAQAALGEKIRERFGIEARATAEARTIDLF